MSILLPDIVSNSSTTAKTLFVCTNTYAKCLYSVSHGVNAICPSCNCYMNKVGTYVKPDSHSDESESERKREGTKSESESESESKSATIRQPSSGKDVSGFVKHKSVVSYMVMDDSSVRSMSTISGITLLNKFDIKDLGALSNLPW
uniref:Uncharacterized protein n=1 Tax=Cucumis sativus TaxID=3659 RepID=A0A0A0KQ76_CUCSA